MTSFSVTRPLIQAPGDVEAVRAVRLDGHVLRGAPGSRRTLVLTGQEFLLFAGIRSAEDAESFANRFGLLGLEVEGQELGADQSVWPLWAKALTEEPDSYNPLLEPIADWQRQAGLMRLGVGLLGLLRTPKALASLRRRVRSRSLPDSLSLPTTDDEPDWPGEWILHGAGSALMSISVEKERPAVVHLDGAGGWRWAARRMREHLAVHTDGREVAVALAVLLSPWLAKVNAAVRVEGDALVAGYEVPAGLLGRMWLQFTNAAVGDIPPRRCAWERCPGPPDRPRIFLWSWGVGIKHRDSLYCDPRCQHAATVARSREVKRARATRPRRTRGGS